MRFLIRVGALVLTVVLLCNVPVYAGALEAPATFADFGVQATATLLDVYYNGQGYWRYCDQHACATSNTDWGVDSATDALYMRWTQTHDPQIQTVMSRLLATAPHYPAPCTNAGCPSWSDTPEWDAVTLMREYAVTRDPRALALAQAAFDFVEQSRVFRLGACPVVPFQLPQPSTNNVKTLETLANAVKAALLLYQATHEPRFLASALAGYADARKYFLDPQVSLYSVHVIDDGSSCTQVPHRFFASVNGDMIWSGITLWRITGGQHFQSEALATAAAVDTQLSDARGVFADVQGENDVVEPLVEAMYDLAVQERQPFAAAWIERNAAAAVSSRAADGSFSRFFDGPSQAASTIWESNGGLALEIAAAQLDPSGTVPLRDQWSADRVVGAPITALPATFSIDGSGVALIGSIGRRWAGNHLRVFIDGVETFDRTGLWENQSMPDDDPVLFAWCWPTAGRHTIRLEPSDSHAAAGLLHLEAVAIP